ncbi:epithelial membrane protein 2 [Erpetoichthys calabaricus]|uniref:Epithelial membrane protein 2 n=1 Tax=Erpetoichthys calabaricus TaxID=27687 RepID=A0A8C4TAC4_ERPCA|nr:epithelial membrane protein 2 [Erpetoichthys calabaricus]
MLVVLAFILLFHIASAILLFISTINSAWWVTGDVYTDIWQFCNSTNYCISYRDSYGGYIEAIQATMILATILCCVAFFVFILHLFRLKQGERFVFSAIIQLLSSLCVMIAASIYTDQYTTFHSGFNEQGTFGYSFILAWIAFPFTLISGIMYLVLRKRK